MKNFFRQLFVESILTAGLLIIAKILGTIGALWITQARYTLTTDTTGIIPFLKISLVDPSLLITVSSYSNAIFTAVMILLVLTVTSRIFLQRLGTQNPRIMAKIIYHNLIEWMESGKTVYPKLISWLIFTWLAALLTLRDALLGLSWYSIPTVFVTFAVVCTILVFLDIERYLHIISFEAHKNAKRIKHTHS